ALLRQSITGRQRPGFSQRVLAPRLETLFRSTAAVPADLSPASDRSQNLHRVVVVGAGFGGLEAVAGLAGSPVTITLIAQRNFHLFQPVLYQVATASLATSEIAWPIRYLVRRRREVTTLLATVVGVDCKARSVLIDNGRALPYDTLILATGARHAYFGHDQW